MFFQELRYIEALDPSRPGDALKTVFSTLNLFRLQYNMDTYGQVCRTQLRTYTHTADRLTD